MNLRAPTSVDSSLSAYFPRPTLAIMPTIDMSKPRATTQIWPDAQPIRTTTKPSATSKEAGLSTIIRIMLSRASTTRDIVHQSITHNLLLLTFLMKTLCARICSPSNQKMLMLKKREPPLKSARAQAF